jgi:hypothetical protein
MTLFKEHQKVGKHVAGPPMAPKLKPNVMCFYFKEEGHWKRNCPKYLEDKKAIKIAGKVRGICDIHVIDIYLTSAWSNTLVFDTSSVAHICNSQHELHNKRRLARNKVTMRVGNSCKVDMVAVSTLPLRLPSGLILVLNKYYFVPVLSMNIVSGSCVMRDGHSFKSETNVVRFIWILCFMLMQRIMIVYSC